MRPHFTFSAVLLMSVLISGSARAGRFVPPGPTPCPDIAGYLGFADPKAVLDVGTEAQAIAVADLDGDGTQDIVAADAVGDRIRIRFGSGDGTFWGTHTWAMGDGTTDVAVADFNGDGHKDIIATSFYTDEVRIRWGAETQRFSSWTDYAVGDGPLDLAAGDLNGDGLDDFVVSNQLGANSITVHLREDNGFDVQQYGAPDSAADVQLVDLDDDGDLDLAYPSGVHNATIAVRLNDGDGTFAAPVSSGMGSAYDESFHALAFGDLDEDGNVDVIAARNTHSLVRALGNGDGTFSSPVEAPSGNNPIHLATADFNQDGDLDIIVSHFYNGLSLSMYLGQGNGNLTGPQDLGVDYADGKYFDVAAADFNGDGFPDVAFTDYASAFLMLSDYPCGPPAPPCREAVGSFAFEDGEAVLDVGTEAQAVAVADLDGDGTQDIVAADTPGDRIRIRFGSGDGTFWGTHTWAMGDGPTDVAVGDFNGDGHQDIAATNFHADRVRIRWGAETQRWSNWSHWDVGDGPLDLAVGDVNGDGRDDFVTSGQLGGNSITVRRRLAAGGFDSQTYDAPDGAANIVLADVDADGDLDMVYPSGIHHARIAVRRNSGAGAFGEPLLSDMGSGLGDNFQALTLGDHDGDGKLDVIAARNTHSLVRALGLGNGRFSSPIAAPTGNNPVGLISADLNLDGKLDLAVCHFAAGQTVSVYLGQGDGNLTGPHDLGAEFPDSRFLSLAAADFDEDGLADLVCTSGSQALLMLSRSPCDDDPPPPPPPPPAAVFIRGDANGSGSVDIADAIFTLGCLFLGTRCTLCPDAEDANDDGQRDLGDPVLVLGVLFSGSTLPAPGLDCGVDPTADSLGVCRYDECLLVR